MAHKQLENKFKVVVGKVRTTTNGGAQGALTDLGCRQLQIHKYE